MIDGLRFVVTGMGRSGTLWLARLLDADPTVRVHHEPINSDADRYVEAYYGRLDPLAWMEKRKAAMHRIWQRAPEQDYAEVNSYLRYEVATLYHLGVPVFVLVRDGRYVVRSAALT